ncbi:MULTISPECIES: PRTRC system protein E [Bacteroidaceae]|uniref:PRTRC system protein E n=1 Tax=Phocaeicola barnesiae TaxID=376804 RepID=A0AAW5N8L1_9BACT|nr:MULTISPECIES: PRTRC system protein E [Bacteroidaceae]MBM6671777.1 PRTRC system protein E [Phocaeicola coprophilus]MBM6720226.1 PRTRC system protein E [Bacteroides gallinaceum]MBM6781699.1 PRTRC system protein E [Bacteroides mediterraneensis]MCR8874069.1 PRTRC system protein E [Phocaeicola barnesiae]
MFFEQIYQLISTGTDLSINIRRMNDKLNVAVMPRNNALKEEKQQHMVPLVLSGTPEELDREFLQAVMAPVKKALGILTNLEAFEKAAEKTASQAKPGKTVEKESKEAREKREKMEKLMKKADDAAAASRFSEAQTWLKQARLLATADKQKEIDAKIQEIQRKANAGSLFGGQEVVPEPSAQQPVAPTAPAQQVSAQAHPVNGNPVQRTDAGPMPFHGAGRNAAVPPAPAAQTTSPQLEYGWGAPYGQQPPTMPPQGFAPNGQPYPPYGQAYPPYPGTYPYMQAQPSAPVQTPPNRPASKTPDFQPHPQESAAPYSFDKEDEEDRELLRENPYAEYPDFPEENRMKDEAQQELELVCC